MSFALLSTVWVLVGAIGLALALWLAQRLRVQHREVEVLSTIFWQQALEETRARVFVRRFRHWWAWVLLVVIASLLWILLLQPRTHSLDGTRHLVLLNWSVDDAQQRQEDLEIAIEFAASLPSGDREIIAVGTQLETLLRPDEPLELARLRSEVAPTGAPRDIDWAIEALAVRATDDARLMLHLVGDAPVSQSRLDSLLAMLPSSDDATPSLRLQRIKRKALRPEPLLATLGVADSINSTWNSVDVWIAIDETNQAFSKDGLSISSNGAPVTSGLTRRQDGVFELRGLSASGAELEISLGSRVVGRLTLPSRNSIRVKIESDVPDTVRELIALDDACEIVDSDADIIVGPSPDANFRLAPDEASAFTITSDNQNPEDALTELVDQLALKQIDATGIAQRSGRVIDVQVTSGDQRKIAIWRSLFTPAFDFQESRACPVFVARSLRWLANRPPLVPYATLGQRLPTSAATFNRSLDQSATTADGRTLSTTLLAPTKIQAAKLAESNIRSWLARFSVYTWLGLIAAVLLISEWILHQRGHIP